ncbi:hypothetical protein ACOMHN_055333 [Nucella lapillus]
MDKKIGNLQATMDEQMDAFRNEMTGMLKENHELKEKIDRLEDKMDDLEGRSRRNNLIFHGISSPEGQTELCKFKDKEHVLVNRKMLREKKSSIFVNEDFTPRGKAHTFDPATQKLVPRQGQP